MMTRRRLIAGGVASMVGPALARGAPPKRPPRLPGPWRPGSRLDNRIGETNPYLNLFNPHNGEQWTGLFGAGGKLLPESKVHLDHFLRDWREGISVPMCYRLLWGMARLTQELELTKPLFVLSGYRTPETNSRIRGASANSFHLLGRAVDIHSPEVAVGDLFKIATRLEIGGTGWYPGRGFVHMDSGRLRNWKG